MNSSSRGAEANIDTPANSIHHSAHTHSHERQSLRIRINALVCSGNPTIADLAAKLTINPNYMYKMYTYVY